MWIGLAVGAWLGKLRPVALWLGPAVLVRWVGAWCIIVFHGSVSQLRWGGVDNGKAWCCMLEYASCSVWPFR